MAISLPRKKVEDLRARVEDGPQGRKEATVREVLLLVRKLHHAAIGFQPGRYVVRRLLQLYIMLNSSRD